MLAPKIADVRVDAVVRDGNDTSRVAQEGTSPRHGVEDRVQAQLRGLSSRPPQALLQAPGATHAQRRQVCDSGAIAEIVGEAAGRQDRLATGKV